MTTYAIVWGILQTLGGLIGTVWFFFILCAITYIFPAYLYNKISVPYSTPISEDIRNICNRIKRVFTGRMFD